MSLPIQHVTRQRELIAELRARHLETFRAEDLLRQFEDSLAMHIADRDRISAELAAAN